MTVTFRCYIMFGIMYLGFMAIMPQNASADNAVAKGREIVRQHCTRCHVVPDMNPYGGIGSTPSFAALKWPLQSGKRWGRTNATIGIHIWHDMASCTMLTHDLAPFRNGVISAGVLRHNRHKPQIHNPKHYVTSECYCHCPHQPTLAQSFEPV